jgi:hypothetical protein
MGGKRFHWKHAPLALHWAKIIKVIRGEVSIFSRVSSFFNYFSPIRFIAVPPANIINNGLITN